MSERMREILKYLMSRNNDTPSTLSKRSGVTQPTVHRFLSGKTRDMKSENAIKIATKGYSITESQLRGDVPINQKVEQLVTKRKKEIEKLNPIQEQLDDRDFSRVVAFCEALVYSKKPRESNDDDK